MNEEDIKYILESLSFKTSIYRDKSKRNLSYNDDEYYSNVLYQYITKLQNNWNELKEWLEFMVMQQREGKTVYISLNDILNKMQELEGNNE